MNVLFIGGTGVISSGCQQRVLDGGHQLYLLNRGSNRQFVSDGAQVLTADYADKDAVRQALGQLEFDAVVDFRVFCVEEMEQAVALFAGRTKQYIFISSGTVYQKPLPHYVITEDAPLGNIHSAYARNKLAAEYALKRHMDRGFPGVIVRPSLTYSDFNPLTSINSRKHPYTLIHRMRKGKPVIVNGDGTSLWTITHNTDFACGLVGLLGNQAAVGEAFHITSDEVLDWNRIYTLLAHAAGVEANLLHIASDYLGCWDSALRESLLGDHSCSAVFDNSKIKKFVPDFVCQVPFEEGAKRIVNWFDEDPRSRALVDQQWDEQMDSLADYYCSRLPGR